MNEKEGSGVAVAGVTPAPVVEAPPSQSAPLAAAQTERGQLIDRATQDVETLFLYRRYRFFENATIANGVALKAGPGVVRRVIIGGQAVGADGTLTLRDGAPGGGRTIARFDTGNGGVETVQPNSIELDAPFEKGLTAIVGGITMAFTVVWE